MRLRARDGQGQSTSRREKARRRVAKRCYADIEDPETPLGSRAGGLESLSRRRRGPFFGEDKETVVLRVLEEFSEACFEEGVDGACALGTTALCPVWPPC